MVVIFGYTWMLKSIEAYEQTRVQRASAAANTWLSKVRQKKSTGALPRMSAYEVHKKKGAQSTAQITYGTCVSCIGVYGNTHTEPETGVLRYINMGWIFFAYLLATVYASNLTAILTLGPEIINNVEDIDQCASSSSCNFCVQDGSANEAYFREHYLSLNIVEKETIETQITSLIDGSCDATELTMEDLFQWAKMDGTVDKCRPQITGLPIVRRNRGMMAKMEKSCYITAINAIYAKFSTALVDNADNLDKVYFPQQAECDDDQDSSSSHSMTFEDLGGAFIVLLLVFVYGIGTLIYGRRVAVKARHVQRQTGSMLMSARKRAKSIVSKKGKRATATAARGWEEEIRNGVESVDSVLDEIRDVVEGGDATAGNYSEWMAMSEEEWEGAQEAEKRRTAHAIQQLLSRLDGDGENASEGDGDGDGAQEDEEDEREEVIEYGAGDGSGESGVAVAGVVIARQPCQSDYVTVTAV